VHRRATEAWHQLGCRPRLLYATATVEGLDRFRDLFEKWDMYMTDERPAGIPADDLALSLRLDGPVLARKLTSLRAMATQTGELLARLDPAIYAEHVAEECFVDAPALMLAAEGTPAASTSRESLVTGKSELASDGSVQPLRTSTSPGLPLSKSGRVGASAPYRALWVSGSGW
jgi:hypothetical protein